MKRFLFLLISALMVSATCLAQEMTIKSFELVANDISASTERRNDVNNEACTLVKVQLAQAGATFRGNVVGDVSYSQSEYRVYMTAGSKRLQVRLEGCLPLDIEFVQHNIGPLKSLTTYKLVLELPEMFTRVATETRTSSSSSTSHKTCPDDHHPHMIDLGLSSGTKWACCNVGASKPEDYGGYYAWGETEVQANNRYDWSSYKHCDGSSDKCHNIGKAIAGTQYDVAHVKMGGSWCMPTYDQIKELIDYCKCTWTKNNGKQGFEVTGSNGGKIFLPAAGFRSEGKLIYKDSYCYYWSSSHNSSIESFAHCVIFSSDGWGWWNSIYQSRGHTVRAVCP